MHRSVRPWRLFTPFVIAFNSLSTWGVILLFAHIGTTLAQGVVIPAEGIGPARAEGTAASALHIVNEFSNRRRLTTFFANEQTPFYGVQMNYVNVGRGN